MKYLFLWLSEFTDEDKKMLFFPHMHKTLTVLSLKDGNISSALSSIILGTLVARDRKTLYKPMTHSSHIMFCGLQTNVLCNNPSDTASYFLE
jgi:hypothetical protein